MKSMQLLLSAVFFIVLITLTPQVYAVNVATPSAKFVDDQMLVQLKPSAPTSDINPLAQAVSGEVNRELLLKNTFVVNVPKGSVDKVIKTLLDMPQVATATPNYIAQKQSVTNDPSLEKEWGMFQIQAASSSTKSAWDTTVGKPAIKIAILDTGIEKTHPDLDGKVIVEKNFTSMPDTEDHDGHGTLVAGIIAAVGNNSSGMAGIAHGASLMNVKVLNDEGIGTYADIADGIVWAADNGAKVINFSFGGTIDLPILQDAVDYAHNKGVVLVAPAGNSGTTSALFPANYEHVISVAATDDTDTKIDSSSFGPWVKVAAPGEKIYSTYKNNSYAYASGTSMASAFTSGLAALVWTTKDCVTNTCVTDRIESTADQIVGTGTNWKFGRINALRALTNEALSATPSAINTPVISASVKIEPEIPPAPVLVYSEPTNIPTPTVKPNIITASNITMWSTGKTVKDIYVRVTITRPYNNSKMANAIVTMELTAPDATVYTANFLTDAQGQATFALRQIREKGTYKAQITKVKLNSYIFSAAKNKTQLIIK